MFSYFCLVIQSFCLVIRLRNFITKADRAFFKTQTDNSSYCWTVGVEPIHWRHQVSVCQSCYRPQGSCGKVMSFCSACEKSHVIIHMTHGAPLYRIPFPYCHLVAKTCSPEDLPLVLTSCQRKWVVRILLECFTPVCHSVHREGGLDRPPPQSDMTI